LVYQLKAGLTQKRPGPPSVNVNLHIVLSFSLQSNTKPVSVLSLL